jgi:hypothetical protein
MICICIGMTACQGSSHSLDEDAKLQGSQVAIRIANDEMLARYNASPY